MLRNTRPFPLVAAAVSLAGLLFCLWVFFTGGEALCLTDGCTLFQDFRLAGISLWQAGAFLFAVLLILSLLRRTREAFLCAAGYLAAAGLVGSRGGRAEQFTAGEVSIRTGGTEDRGTQLRALARQLMAPYSESGGADAFAFRGVLG